MLAMATACIIIAVLSLTGLYFAQDIARVIRRSWIGKHPDMAFALFSGAWFVLCIYLYIAKGWKL